MNSVVMVELKVARDARRATVNPVKLGFRVAFSTCKLAECTTQFFGCHKL